MNHLHVHIRSLVVLCHLLLLGGLGACQRSPAVATGSSASARNAGSSHPSARPALPTTKHVVLFLGDSLTAGFRLAPTEAYPSLIAEHWKKQGQPWRSRNAGVSGDTTAGVIRRLDWVLTDDIHTVFLAIGANDGLRGQSLAHIEKNLHTIITRIQSRGIQVILAGIKLPRNYGKNYYEQFEQIYPRLAQHFRIPLMPFLLQDVASIKALNLPDGIHPNTQGHQIIAQHVLRFFTQHKLFSTSTPSHATGKP